MHFKRASIVIAKLCREPVSTEVALHVSSQIERGEAA